jgi:GntR family transcriptional regulator
MEIEINLTSHIPIYLQLIDQIKHLIATGELAPGDQLPTVRQLAADLRVNFNTIARAYRLLDEEGVISTQHGRGTFILEPQSGEAAEAMRRRGLERLTQYYLIEADRLSNTPQEVRTIFDEKIQQWIDEGTPPLPDGENN